jgi:hypothetical protein
MADLRSNPVSATNQESRVSVSFPSYTISLTGLGMRYTASGGTGSGLSYG